MVRFSTTFVVLLSTAFAQAATVKRDVATVKADITAISTQVTTLENAITAFPDSGGSLAAALAIRNTAVALDNTVKKSTTDTQATDPFSEVDGQSILTSAESIEKNILDALNSIVAKKPAVQALPIGGMQALVLQVIKNLSIDTGAFADALIDKSPADLVTKGKQIKSSITGAFATAIAAYS